MAQGKKMALGKHSGLENEWKEDEKKIRMNREQRTMKTTKNKEENHLRKKRQVMGKGEGGG